MDSRKAMLHRRLENTKKICQAKFRMEMATEDVINWSTYEKSQRKLKEKVMDALYDATYVSDAEMPGYKTTASLYNFAFLLVLVGVELDFWGFIMAFPQYWKFSGEHNLIVKFFLICMPAAYVVSVLWCYHFERPETSEESVPVNAEAADDDAEYGMSTWMPSRRRSEGAAPATRLGLSRLEESFAGATMRPSSPSLQAPARTAHPDDHGVPADKDFGREEAHNAKVKREMIRQTVREKPAFLWFRTVPLARLYLVTKNLKRDDVELIFRLNSLSSFSLGVAQCVSVAFIVVLAGEPCDTIVAVNLISQAINWTITFIYYATALADDMKKSITITAVTQHLRDRQQKDLVKFLEDVRLVAGARAEAKIGDNVVNEVQKMKTSLIAEIFFMTQTRVKLDKLTVAELLEYRSRLYKRQIHNMARS